jgi:DNA-binding response OmpR family regulator
MLTRILVIEDDPIIGEMLTLYLTEEQFTVQRAETIREGVQALLSFAPDVLLLDLMLPDSDGMDVAAEFRRHTELPIIVISMKTAVSDRIQAISAGADDYLVKPFSMQELKARIGAVLRRSHLSSAVPAPSAESSSSVAVELQTGILIDRERRTILLDGAPVETTFSEFEIMKLFCDHPGKVYSREELINAVRGIDSFVNDRAIDVHVTNLRRKLENNPKEPRYIKTVWGVGYKFIR